MKKNIILSLLSGITVLSIIKFLSKTKLYFSDEEAIMFLNYLSKKNNLIGVNNAVIWFFIIASVIVTYLNKVNREG